MLQLVHRISATLANATFAAFVVLALCTPAWRVGPFTWWPVWRASILHGQPAQPGLLSLLPILCVLAWVGTRLAVCQRQPWQWGAAAMTLPLLALSLLILCSLDPVLNERTVVQGIGLGLFWFSYLYVLNRRPRLTFPLLIVVLIQGSVAVAQFGLQRDLGLAFLGEFPLDPQVRGTSVLWNSDQEAWLRGYGLTAHPNVLGGTIAVLLLLLLPKLHQRRGWRQMGMAAGLAIGALGLLVSFSRTGWLAFLGGLVYWAVSRDGRQPFWRHRAVWVPFLIVPVFLLLYHDLILSRWIHLDTLIEARSIQERLRDAQVALTLIGTHPWLGVGVGNGLDAARAVRPDAGPVHNVPLLVTAELGVIGALSWLLFMVFPLWRRQEGTRQRPWANPLRRLSTQVHGYEPAWVGLLVAGLFDTPLWLTTSWRAALLLGLLAALQVRAIDRRREDT